MKFMTYIRALAEIGRDVGTVEQPNLSTAPHCEISPTGSVLVTKSVEGLEFTDIRCLGGYFSDILVTNAPEVAWLRFS